MSEPSVFVQAVKQWYDAVEARNYRWDEGKGAAMLIVDDPPRPASLQEVKDLVIGLKNLDFCLKELGCK